MTTSAGSRESMSSTKLPNNMLYTSPLPGSQSITSLNGGVSYGRFLAQLETYGMPFSAARRLSKCCKKSIASKSLPNWMN